MFNQTTIPIYFNYFHTITPVSEYKLSSLKVMNKNYIDYLVSKEKCTWKPLLLLWKVGYQNNIQILRLIFISQEEANVFIWVYMFHYKRLIAITKLFLLLSSIGMNKMIQNFLLWNLVWLTLWSENMILSYLLNIFRVRKNN